MSRIKKGLATIAAAGGMLAGGVVAASPAEAATGYDRCPHGSFCVFSGYGGTGTIGIFKQGSSDLRLQGLDNNAHSIWNRTGRSVEGFDGYNYQPTPPDTLGPIFKFGPYSAPNDLNDFVGSRLSSVRAV